MWKERVGGGRETWVRERKGERREGGDNWWGRANNLHPPKTKAGDYKLAKRLNLMN